MKNESTSVPAGTEGQVVKSVGNDDIVKKFDSVTEKVIEKTNAKINDTKTGLEAELKKVTTELLGLQKSFDDLKKSTELVEKSDRLKKSIYVRKYGKIKEGSFGELVASNYERIQKLAHEDVTGSAIHLGYLSTDYVSKATGGFEFGGDKGNISGEERITRIADEGPNFKWRVANNIPSAMTGPVNTIRFPYQDYGNKATAIQNAASDTPARLGTNPLNVDNSGGRAIGQPPANATLFDFADKETKLSIVSSYHVVAQELLDDTPNLEQYIRYKLLNNHYDKLDSYILNHDGSGNVAIQGINEQAFKYVEPGAGTAQQKAASIRKGWLNESGPFAKAYDQNSSTTNFIDAIATAKAILYQRNFMPDTLVLNVQDCVAYSVFRTKVTGNFLNLNQAANPTPLNIWSGLNIIPSNAQASGTFSIFDSNCLSLRIRDAVAVEARITGQENFVANRLTIRTNQRLALVVFENGAFVANTYNYFINNILNVISGETATGVLGNPDAAVKTTS